MASANRYHKVNLESFDRHGTVEFRHHSGTIEADKIINWVVLMVGFTEASIVSPVSLNKVTNSVNYFRKWLNLTNSDTDPRVATCARYVAERFHHFNPTLNLSSVL